MAWFSPRPLLLPDIIDLNARFQPDKPAFVDEDRVTTWSAFGDGTARVANALSALGLEPGDRVIVLMKNSYEMCEAMYGVIRGGFVAVPLNVSISDDAVVGMVTDSTAKALFASGEHVARVAAMRDRLDEQLGSNFIAPDAPFEDWLDYSSWRDAASPALKDPGIGPTDECNLIYSSGTTGLPKGIVHDHACREAWGSDMAVALRYHAGARTLCNLGLFSNISWVAMLATIFSGGTIVISRRFDVINCLETIERERITHMAMVPLQFQKLVESGELGRFDLSSLDAYMCCGSPLSADLKRRITDEMPGSFIELYGLTEGLVTILGPEDMADKTDSVGRPCPGQYLAIVGSDDQELPDGEAGEIAGTSRFLMAGYHGNDEANEEATWVHPSGERWLRTGDIGRLDDDGFLYLVDRKKDMIISGGQNIYPADIEATILAHDDVSEIAVIGVASKKWGETPLAIIVPTADAGLSPDELTAWANSRLGKQQRVAASVYVDELPRNPNGKILKRELRKHYADLEF